MRDPEFIIFTGPMFGSKTTRMLAAVDRYRWQNKKIVAFKPQIDDRYSINQISTHNGANIPAQCVSCAEDIINHLNEIGDFDVIAVDEAFMIKGVAETLLTYFRNGKTIVVSTLQLSSKGEPFREVKEMMPWATKIDICPAVCPVTGRDAFYTHRKFKEEREIIVGGADMYEPRCFEKYEYVNLKFKEDNDELI